MKTLKLIFHNKELLKKIVFVLAAFLLYRVAVFIPIPMISVPDELFNNELLGFLNAFTGGALENLSVISLGVGPYITASIVVQILQTDLVPVLTEWSEQGEVGKQKTNQLTRYLAIGLAFIQALAITIGIDSLSIGVSPTPIVFVYLAIIITAGTSFLLWLGDQITVKGVGNGVSMIIAAGIISSLPATFITLWTLYITPLSANFSTYVSFMIVVVLYVSILLGIIFMQAVDRKVPIQYANRSGQSKLSGKHDSNIPIKLNSAGVISVIFAITILSLPLTIVQFANLSGPAATLITEVFSSSRPIGFTLYIFLIFVFTFFYSFLQVNPEKVATNLSNQNAYIPGVRPGNDTEIYFSKILFKVTLLGAVYLSFVAVVPILTAWAFDLPPTVTVGGTSLLIVVGVAVETFKQITTEANKQEYKGFIR